MAFRSHVVRPFDFGLWSNRAMFFMVGVFAVAAVVAWVDGADLTVFWAPAQAFVFWGLVREIDPDHQVPALVAGAAAAAWVLSGLPILSALSVGAMLVAARLVLNSTGRRPLVSDLVVLGAYAAGVSLTRVGWVAGVGLAIAIYVDGRIADGANIASVVTAGVAALAASVLASAAGAFSIVVVEVRPVVVAVAGALAIATILRSPPEPFSRVDSRMRWRLDHGRLHAARALVGVLAFAAALLAGAEGVGIVPLVGAVAIALLSAEIERARRTV